MNQTNTTSHLDHELDLERTASNTATPRKHRKKHSMDRLHPHTSDKDLPSSSLPRISGRIRNSYKPILDHLDQTMNQTNTTCHLDHELDLERTASKTVTPRKDRKEHSIDRLHHIHLIKTCLPHPYREFREGFGIPINYFGSLGPNHEPNQYNESPRS